MDNRNFGPLYISNRAWFGTVAQANYSWNTTAEVWTESATDWVYLARRLWEPEFTSPAFNAAFSPVFIGSQFNYRFGDDPDFPLLKDSAPLKKALAQTQERFELVTAQDGGFYGILLSGEAESVTIPLKIQAEQLSFLLTSSRSARTQFYNSVRGARVFPKVARIVLEYTDGTRKAEDLRYKYSIADWNEGFGGYDMRMVCFGKDDRGVRTALNSFSVSLEAGKVLKSVTFRTLDHDGIRPVLLALSAVNVKGRVPDSGLIPAEITQKKRTEAEKTASGEEDFIYADFSRGMGNARAGSHGFEGKIVTRFEDADGRTALRIDVPRKKSAAGTARVFVDIPVDPATRNNLKAMFFDFRVDRPFGVQRTDCYVLNADMSKGRVQHTFDEAGNDTWQAVRLPFSRMAKYQNTDMSNGEITTLRISFWMHNTDYPVVIRIADGGCSTSARSEVPLYKD